MSPNQNPFESLLPRSKPLPAAIHKRVTQGKYGELIFQGKRLEDGKFIPILTEAYDEYYSRSGSRTIPFFYQYSQGVIEGMNHDFIPFVDTPETRKELIINEVTQDIYLFPTVESDDKEKEKAYLSDYMYQYGIQIGKLYKAWCIVCQNPGFFLPDIEELDHQINSKGKALNGPKAVTNFKDMFRDSKYFEASLNILREIEPAAIDDDNNYIGNLKSVIPVWIAELEKAGIVKSIHNADQLTKILNATFHGLNIARSTIYATSEKANIYKAETARMISNMKSKLG